MLKLLKILTITVVLAAATFMPAAAFAHWTPVTHCHGSYVIMFDNQGYMYHQHRNWWHY